MNVNFFVFSAIFAGPRFSATVATRRHDFFSLLEAFSPGRILAYLLLGTHFKATLGGGRAGSFTTSAFSFGFHF